MRAIATFRSAEEFEGEPEVFDFYGYSFRIGDDFIPFDFETDIISIYHKDGYLIIELDSEMVDEERYKDERDRLGYAMADVTAEKLSGTTKIGNVYYQCFADKEKEDSILLLLESFELMDEEGNIHLVAPEIIRAYNKSVLEDIASNARTLPHTNSSHSRE